MKFKESEFISFLKRLNVFSYFFSANMDAVTWSSGDTPLNRALVLMWYPAVALLLRQGADPNKCDKRPVFLSYSSVYDNLGLARRRRKLGVIQMLVYAG